MADFSTARERQRAWFFPLPWGNWPFPQGTLDAGQRAAIWGSFFSGPVPHAPFFNPNITADTLLLLIEQFKRSPDLKSVVSIFTDQMQTVENTNDNLIMSRLIDTSEGVQLDGIGDIVGEPRNGRSDDAYREAIKFKTFINASNGEPNRLLDILKNITNGTDASILEFFPASAFLFTDGTPSADLLAGSPKSNLQIQMERVAPAGVQLDIVSSFGGIQFEFDTEGGIPYNEGDGYSELNYTEGGQPVGGTYSELIS